ncbi:MAG: flagellar basal body-associated protein FliL [Labedaea sp.]
MSWQEELRKLDEELAAGQISADDYRVRRDQVLSSAVSAGPEAPRGNESTQLIAPLGARAPQVQPPAQPPAAEPVSDPGAGAASGEQDADKTQIVPGRSDSDTTQAVGGWQVARPSDNDRTQVVPGIPGVPRQTFVGGHPPRPAPGQFPPPPGYGWQQPDEDAAPWAGSTFPPLAASASPEWIRQGPEVFERSSGTGRRVLIVVLVVLVLAGLGTGLYFFVLKKNGNQPAAGGATSTTQPPPSTTKPTSTTRPRPSDPNVALLEDMPAPPASAQQDGKVADVAQFVALKMMDQAEVDLLTAAGVTKVPLRSAVRKPPDDGPTPDSLSAMVIPTGSNADAVQLAQKLRDYQEAHGLKYIAEPLPNMPPTVVFEKTVTADRALYRGLWVSGKNVIRITTVQAPLSNEAALSGSYRNHAEVMLRVFPSE